MVTAPHKGFTELLDRLDRVGAGEGYLNHVAHWHSVSTETIVDPGLDSFTAEVKMRGDQSLVLSIDPETRDLLLGDA